MKAIIAECLLYSIPSRVEEVRSMAEGIGYDVAATMVQRRDSAHHSFTLGEGKLEELKRLVSAYDADSVIFTNALPGSQVFRIRQRVGDVNVIDRNLLILEVFERRAMTKEAKLQIELARMKYTFSWGRGMVRLRGIAGEQVGAGGPGQYPYKEYEMAARKKISAIRRALADIRSKNEALRRRRHELGYPVVALAGYTQSGKTTFFNAVAGEGKVVGLGPFTTLSTCARRFRLGPRSDAILIDSIGFIEDMHSIIVDAFAVTIGEIVSSDLILLFIDASEEERAMERKLRFVSGFTRRLGVGPEMIICVNKIDITPVDQLAKVRERVAWHFPGVESVAISAKEGTNVKELLQIVSSRLKGPTAQAQVPAR